MPEFEDYTLIAFINALKGTLETTVESDGVIATPAQAIDGTNNTTIMTPLRVQQFVSTIQFSFAPLDQAVPLSSAPTGWFLGKGSTADDDFQWQEIAIGGSVQTVAVATANGFAGTSDGDPTNPVLTLKTTLGTGNIPVSDGTGFQAAPLTGAGNIVLSTGATLVAPNLGTPATLVGTNITGTASGLTAGSVTTNANLTGPITSVGNATSVASQTGTGSTFVMNTSPTLVTPNLGTPSAIDLTNATNVPREQPRVVATASTATLTPNSATTDIAAVTAQAAGLTIAAPTGSPVDGQRLTIRIRDNGTTRALTWNAAYVPFASGQLPSTTVINKTHYFDFDWNAATSAWELVGGNPVAGLWG